MKRFFRIMVPLILLIAVLLSLCWYFLVYDQAFTKELLLRQARYYESNNKHKYATWLYDLAYYQSSQDDDVAIELADQYRKAGILHDKEQSVHSSEDRAQPKIKNE